MDLKTTHTVHNPLEEDFTHEWDGQPFTIKAGETVTHPAFLAIHLAKHLADAVLREKGKFNDVIKNGRKVEQHITIVDKEEIMKALIDRGLEKPVKEEKKPEKEVVKLETPFEDMDIEELRRLGKQKRIKSAHMMGKKKLVALLNE